MRFKLVMVLALLLGAACGTAQDPAVQPPVSPPAAPEPDPIEVVQVYLHTGNPDDCGEVVGVDRVVDGSASLTTVMELLLAGPTEEESSAGLAGWFDASTEGLLISAELENGVARVDFQDLRQVIPNASTSCGSAMLLAQLDSTAEDFGATQTLYSIEGDPDTFYNWLQMGTPEI